MFPMNRREHGYALIDVGVALALTGVLLALALSTWGSTLRGRRVTRVAEDLTGLLRYAQQLAVADSVDACLYRVTVSTTDAVVRRIPPDPTTGCAPAAAPDPILRQISPYPSGVTTTAQVVEFLPSGRVVGGSATITVAAGTSSRTVSVEGATGRTEVGP